MTLAITPLGSQALIGKRLRLEKASPADAEFLCRTYANDDFMDCYRLAQDRHLSVEQVRRHLESEQPLTPQQLKKIEWVIRRKDNDAWEPVGLASLASYQAAHNRAEFLVGIINPEERGGGLALEASLLVLEFAFHQARIHKLISIVYAFNRKAQHNTLHLGFRQEALLREHYYHYRDGKYIDLFQNSLLEKDFYHNIKLGRWSKRLLGRDITLAQTQAPKVAMLTIEKLDEAVDKVLSHTIS